MSCYVMYLRAFWSRSGHPYSAFVFLFIYILLNDTLFAGVAGGKTGGFKWRLGSITNRDFFLPPPSPLLLERGGCCCSRDEGTAEFFFGVWKYEAVV